VDDGRGRLRGLRIVGRRRSPELDVAPPLGLRPAPLHRDLGDRRALAVIVDHDIAVALRLIAKASERP
jgi:hypothetical protein